MDTEDESIVNEQRQDDGSSPPSVVRDILPDSPVLSENLMSNDTIKLERSGSETDSKTILHNQLRASLERTVQQLSGASASENGKFVLLYKPPKLSKNFFLIPKKKILVKHQIKKVKCMFELL